MDQRTATLALPETPRSFGFFVDGQTIEAGPRGHFERRSPGHDVPVTRMPWNGRLNAAPRIWASVSPAARPAATVNGTPFIQAGTSMLSSMPAGRRRTCRLSTGVRVPVGRRVSP